MNGHKTAISRKKPSRPTLMYVEKGLINAPVLDYGCGKGADVDYLSNNGYSVDGFDPYYKPTYNVEREYRTVMSNYVLNVIPTKSERVFAIVNILNNLMVGGVALITTRSKYDVEQSAKYNRWDRHNDGFITYKKTFQVGLEPEDIFELVNHTEFKTMVEFEVLQTGKYTTVKIKKVK